MDVSIVIEIRTNGIGEIFVYINKALKGVASMR